MDPTVQVAIVAGASTVLAAALGEVRQRRQRNALKGIEHQVTNSHKTNLRDDIDKVLTGQAAVLEVLAQHTEQLAGLHEEIRTERKERLAVSDRLDHHIEGEEHS